jgi:hypothetical protein
VIGSLSLMLMLCAAVAAVTPAGGAAWSAHPMPFYGPTSVSCVAADACTAVGTVDVGLGTAATGWDGRRWRMKKTPSSPVIAAEKSSGFPDALEAVSCTSTKACIAVGEYVQSIRYGNATEQTSPVEMPLAERWNGARWSLLPFPSVPAGWQRGVTSLDVVSCTSGSACMAVGSGSGGLFSERWNGTRWTVERMAEPPGTGVGVDGLSCSSSTACIAVGNYDRISGASPPFAERWNGNNWTLEPLAHIAAAPDLVLMSVSCTSARACIAVGESYPHPAQPVAVTAAERWNGTSWSVQRTANGPGHYNELAGVSCASSRACTAVGDTMFRLANGGWRFQPLVERWDGTSWSIEHTPSFGDAFLEAVSCTSSTICTAIGGNSSPSGAVAVQSAPASAK